MIYGDIWTAAGFPAAGKFRRVFGTKVASASELGLLIRTTGDKRQLARELFRLMVKPGRPSVMTAAHLVLATPPEVMGATLAAWAKAPLPRSAWAAMLCLAWIGRSAYVCEAAGDELKDWFARADLMHPPAFLKGHLCSAEELPETVRLFRGGSSASKLLKRGYSWSSHKETAAAFAIDRVATYGGRPVVIVADVPKADLVMAIGGESVEYVTLNQQAVEVYSSDRDELQSLADKWTASARERGDTEDIKLSLDDEDCWRGWVGDD